MLPSPGGSFHTVLTTHPRGGWACPSLYPPVCRTELVPAAGSGRLPTFSDHLNSHPASLMGCFQWGGTSAPPHHAASTSHGASQFLPHWQNSPLLSASASAPQGPDLGPCTISHPVAHSGTASFTSCPPSFCPALQPLTPQPAGPSPLSLLPFFPSWFLSVLTPLFFGYSCLGKPSSWSLIPGSYPTQGCWENHTEPTACSWSPPLAGPLVSPSSAWLGP